MRCLVSDILRAVDHPEHSLKSIQGCYVKRNANGYPIFSVGASVVLFRAEWCGRLTAMRCYRDSRPYLREIYGERYYPAEMVIFPDDGLEREIDVVLCDWVEGETLESLVMRGVESDDRGLFVELSRSFDRLAIDMLCREDWAHGDLCCENIIVDDEGVMHLIDHDATYLDSIAGGKRYVQGRLSYMTRYYSNSPFGASMDNYSIAIIATSLHALAIDPSLGQRYPTEGMLLIDGQQIGSMDYEALDEVSDTLARDGDFVGYRLSCELRYGEIETERLLAMLRHSRYGERLAVDPLLRLSMFERRGVWGYLDHYSGEEIIPPLFDEGFEFRGTEAEVRIGCHWFRISNNM